MSKVFEETFDDEYVDDFLGKIQTEYYAIVYISF